MPRLYLTFSPEKLERSLARAAAAADPARELRRLARGVHTDEAAALAYAAAEGPSIVLFPGGRTVLVELTRDAAEDARIAADQTARAERLRRMTLRDERGPSRSTAEWRRFHCTRAGRFAGTC